MSEIKNVIAVPHVSHPCHVVRPDEAYTGKQGLTYVAGISVRSVVSRGLCMHLVHLPPGARTAPHVHQHHETAVYVLRGEVQIWYGDQLEHQAVVRAGEFRHIPAGVLHHPFNATETHALAVLACTDLHEQESVVLLPELDRPHP